MKCKNKEEVNNFWHNKYSWKQKFWMVIFIPKAYADYYWSTKLSFYERISLIVMAPAIMIIMFFFILAHTNQEARY